MQTSTETMQLATGTRAMFFAVLFLACSVPVAAGSVTLHRDGAAVALGEVCRFRADDREDPFRRWLSSQEVTCAPANAPLDFPAGEWNVFARSGSDAISTLPLLVGGEAPPASLALELEAGAVIAPMLPEGRTGVAYSPDRGSAIPLPPGNESLVVPAGHELWLFVVARGQPEAMIVVPPLEPGTRRTIDARGGGTASLIGWIRIPESDRRAIETARRLSLPVIRALSESVTRNAAPLPPLERLHGSFFSIPDVPAGSAEIALDGRGWLRTARRLTARPGLTVLSQPLVAAAAATLVVNWSAADGLPELNASLGSCEESRRPPQFELTIFACPGSRPGRPIDPEACSAVRTETLPAALPFGSVAIEDVAPGLYQAQLRFGDLPPVRASALARPAQQTPTWVSASYRTVYGSITHGGEPLLEPVTIELPGGYGFAPAGKGEYRAALTRLPAPDTQIVVAACDGSPKAILLTDRPLRPDARYDLDIPDNRLDLNVTDAFTREPLDGAVVRVSVMSLRVPRRVVMTRTTAAGANGSVSITALPERELRISVSHGGYEKQDVPPFSIASRETRTLDIQLVPLRGSRGRIVSATPFAGGAVFWFALSGEETERAELAPDGTFVFANPHESSESMTVVSASHPLWVSRSPRLELDGTATIRFPDAPPRSFSVSVAAANRGESRHIGVTVGGVRVPQPVLRQHQFLRGQEAITRGAAALHFIELAQTGAFEVLLGLRVEEVPAAAVGMDLFALPQLADAPRLPLPPGVTAVEFE